MKSQRLLVAALVIAAIDLVVLIALVIVPLVAGAKPDQPGQPHPVKQLNEDEVRERIGSFCKTEVLMWLPIGRATATISDLAVGAQLGEVVYITTGTVHYQNAAGTEYEAHFRCDTSNALRGEGLQTQLVDVSK